MADLQGLNRRRLEDEKADALRELRGGIQKIGKSWQLPRTKRTQLREAAVAYLDRVMRAESYALLNSCVVDSKFDIEGAANRALDLARENANEPAVHDAAAAAHTMLVDAFCGPCLREVKAQERLRARFAGPSTWDPLPFRFGEFVDDPEESGYPAYAQEPTPPVGSHLGPAQKMILPSIPRDALKRIEQGEKAAKDRYDEDKRPYFPVHLEFSFLEDSIFRSISRILSYLQIFTTEVLDANLQEYLEYAPVAILTNEALLKSFAENIFRQTEILWGGYGQILMHEPTRRRNRAILKIADGTIDKYPELEPSSYPGAQEWADFIKRMSDPGSEMARMDAQYEATIKQAIDDRIRHYQALARARLPVAESAADPEPAETENAQGPASSLSDLAATTQSNALTWQDIEIRFLSDERVQIIKNGEPETHNYAELGFEDRRNETPNSAWHILRDLATTNGTIGLDLVKRRKRTEVEKRVQEIRRTLRKHFGIDQDPVPLLRGIGYKTAFKIVWSRAANT